MREGQRKSLARTFRKAPTRGEARLWDMLRNKQLNGWRFRRQAPIDGFVADFLCHEPKLVVELDGSAHDTPDRQERDAQRDAQMEAKGFTVIRMAAGLMDSRPQDAILWIAFVGRRLLAGLPPYPDEEEKNAELLSILAAEDETSR
jgi:very-short-patch-repair endonuclease